MNKLPKTIFIDIDGTILKHHGDLKGILENPPEVLQKVHEAFTEWNLKGYNIIVVTGRRESMRELTEKHLFSAGIFYDKLIMGVGGGDRILINDCKADGRKAAEVYNVKRDEGLKELINV